MISRVPFNCGLNMLSYFSQSFNYIVKNIWGDNQALVQVLEASFCQASREDAFKKIFILLNYR